MSNPSPTTLDDQITTHARGVMSWAKALGVIAHVAFVISIFVCLAIAADSNGDAYYSQTEADNTQLARAGGLLVVSTLVWLLCVTVARTSTLASMKVEHDLQAIAADSTGPGGAPTEASDDA